MGEAGPEGGEVGEGAEEVVVAEVEGVDVGAVAELAREGAGELVVAEADDAELGEEAQAFWGDGAGEALAWQAELGDAVSGAHDAVPGAGRGRVGPVQLRSSWVEHAPERGEGSSVSCQVLGC